MITYHTPPPCNIANLFEYMAMFYFVKRLATLRIVTEPTFIDNKFIKQKVIKEERTFQKYNCTAETMPPTVLHVGDIIGL